MKNVYLFIIVLFSNLVIAQSFQDTKGELSVSGSGTASYKVPIALPPGIKDVAPQLALVYNGSSVQGMAGMGWNLVGISSISRISSRLDLDGIIDAVDFDNLDRFALDGQRLIEKSGVYGIAGTTYQTENYSNLKIESAGSFTSNALEKCFYDNFGNLISCDTPFAYGPESFTVTFPDGSQAFYGGTTDSRGLMEWMINRWIDPQGNYIDYTYETENNTIRIKKISWGKNINSTSTYENLIEFTYKNRIRTEYSYLAGIKIAATKILSFVTVKTGGQLFRTYTLEHEDISGNYQRVKSIIETNGANETANPITFKYNTTADGFAAFSYYNSPTNSYLNDVRLSGDFDGDGNVDFVTNDKLYINPINNSNVWTGIDFSVGSKNYFTATILTNNKLNQFQSIVKTEETVNSINFNIYNLASNSLGLSYTKTINFDNDINLGVGSTNTYYDYLINTYSDNCSEPSMKQSNKYLEGDFNGDGISEVLIVNRKNETYNRNEIIYSNWNGGDGYSCETSIEDEGEEWHLLDLNPNASNLIGNNGFVKLQISSVAVSNVGLSNSPNAINLDENKKTVADFNGDGKSDILIINPKNKNYQIISFKQLNAAPWIEIEILGQGTFTEYDKDKQLVFGDFNGDSKTDIMIPEANDSTNWFLYQATGVGFERIAYPNFELYQPYWHGSPFASRTIIRNYRAADLNKDGKSDFVTNEYESWCVDVSANGTCDRNARGWFKYKQNLGSITTQPVFAANITTYASSDYGYEDQINLLIGDFKNHQANFNFAFIQGSQIWKGSFNKDLSEEATLIKVTEANETIIQDISYKTLVPSSDLGTVDEVYHSSNSETYPFTELIKVPTMKVVDKLTVTAAGQTKSQLYKYFGLVAHSKGSGVLGFKKIAQSSWYNDANPNKIWSCSQMNPQLMGQKIYEWTYSGDNHSSFDNPPITTSASYDLGITTNTFSSNFLPNGVKIIVPTKSEKKDFLTNLTTKTEYFYDSYWNVNRTLFTNPVGTKETINTFYDNPTGTGKLYALGRITQTNETVAAYGDTFTTEEKFTYNPTATNLVKQSLKKGHLTDYITTDYVYDMFGNVIQKTISSPGVSNRTISDKYDTNGRFVIEKTDHEGYITSFEYNPLGQVTKSTNYLNVIASTTYDTWGKITQNTTTGVSSSVQIETLAYTRFADGGFSVTTSDPNTNEVSRSFQDVLGRNIKSTTKGFASNTWISKSTEYDFLGRKTRESEPYFDVNPTTSLGAGTKWNSVTYDYLSRPLQQLAYNGRTQTISYNGLSTTTIDGPKTIKVTIDANGNKTEVVDNTETLSYTYYANGLPKENSYGNHKITMKYDGWGRQTYMLDPSVSTTPYTYTYNNYGEMLTEVTPTGTTTINYSPTGKVTKKTSIGNNTNTINNYTYSAKGLLTNETGTNNGRTFSYTYGFNSLFQLISKTEVTPDNLTHLKTYAFDNQGRILQEQTYSYLTNNPSVNNGNLTVEYGYNTYNGILEQTSEVTASGVRNLLWKLNSANEKMQALMATLGNTMQITNTYDAYDYIKTINHTAGTNVALNLEYQFNAARGTLNYRKNTIAGLFTWNETFAYDSFERLASWTDPTGSASNTYETDGRIKDNNGVGTYNYYDTNSRYRKTSATLNTIGNNLYASRTPQVVSYNMFKNPINIKETTRGSVAFLYNTDNTRSSSSVETEDKIEVKTKYYAGISDVEVIRKHGQSLQFITYIAGSPYTAAVALEKTYTVSGNTYTPNTQEFLYLHRDYQGTILAISGNAGVIKERRQFDPWGVLKKHFKGNTVTSSTALQDQFFELLTDRGYTGHEHFFSVGIIHMNGRIYDPVLRSFLSPDPLISNPNDTQNYNRFAYALNNPLLYIDPSGNEPITLAIIATAALIGALIAGVVYTGVALYNGTFTWGGLAKSVIIGAVSGAATSCIGSIALGVKVGTDAMSISSQLLRQGVSALMHGVAQGFIAGVSGGDLGQSFITAAISSIVAGGYGMIGGVTQTGVGQVLFGTVAGGVTSRLQGGNFWEGAAIGLIVSGLNHAAHKMADDGDIDPPGKKKSAIQKIKSNPDKISEAGEAFLSIKQIKMIDARQGLAVKDKIGTFGKFASKYSKYAKAAKVLGYVNKGATAYNTYNDINDYSNGNLSGARLSYRLGGTAAGIGTSAVIGGEFGGPWGAVAGFLVGAATSVGEFIYDGWNNSVMPVINQGTYQINNNQAWTNFHP